MLPRVKLYFAIALTVFATSLLLLTDAGVPAQGVDTPAASGFSPLIAFRPFSKIVHDAASGDAAADSGLPDVYVYESGSGRYEVKKNVLTGKGAWAGEKIVFDGKIKIEIVKGTPPSTASADASWPLYLTLDSNPKPCWHIDGSAARANADTSIERPDGSALITSTTVQVCSP